MSEELNLEQIARDVETLRYEGAAIDAEEKRMGLNYPPESPASGGYVFRGIAARYVELAQHLRAALGRRGAQPEPLARLEAVETLLREQVKWTRGVHFKVSADGLEAHARDIHEALAALRGVGVEAGAHSEDSHAETPMNADEPRENAKNLPGAHGGVGTPQEKELADIIADWKSEIAEFATKDDPYYNGVRQCLQDIEAIKVGTLHQEEKAPK